MKRKSRRKKRKSSSLYYSIFILGLLIITASISFKIFYYINSNEKELTKKDSKNSTEIETSTKKDVQPIKKDVLTNVTVNFAGDCTIGTDTKFGYANSFTNVFNNNNDDYSYFLKNVKPIFEKDDLTIVNLETTFTNATVKSPKTFNFKAPPEYANVLTSSSVEGVNISNNHIYDYNQKGFEDTIATLKANKIGFFGEKNFYIKEVRGIKLGFLGYLGFNDTADLRASLKKDISLLREKGCSAIAVTFHWGIEGSYEPIDTQKSLAHYAIDNGADLIIGHHPHVIEGLETYNNKIICYSLGNFCFGGNFNPRDKDTFIFQIKFNFKNKDIDSYDVKVIPCSVSSVNYKNDYCPTPSTKEEKTRILDKLNNISPNSGFKISDSFNNIDVKKQ